MANRVISDINILAHGYSVVKENSLIVNSFKYKLIMSNLKMSYNINSFILSFLNKMSSASIPSAPFLIFLSPFQF